MKTFNKRNIYKAGEDSEEVILSVVLLTYNHERYIRTCLESIVLQKTSFKYELIVGDDASTDRTPEVILEYAAKYPDIVVPVLREKNVGAVANLVGLLKMAKGRYIAGCEGDDFWTDNKKLELQFRFLERRKDHIACSHDIETVNEDGTPADKQKINWISPNRHYRLKDYKGIMLPGHPVALVFRNIFKTQEDPNRLLDFHTSIADRTLAVMLSVRGKIYRADRKMAAYRLHSSNKTNMTNSIYNNLRSYLIDYELNEKIEEYIYTKLHKRISFAGFRWKLFIKLGIKTLLKLSEGSLDNFKKVAILHTKWCVGGHKKERSW